MFEKRLIFKYFMFSKVSKKVNYCFLMRHYTIRYMSFFGDNYNKYNDNDIVA